MVESVMSFLETLRISAVVTDLAEDHLFSMVLSNSKLDSNKMLRMDLECPRSTQKDVSYILSSLILRLLQLSSNSRYNSHLSNNNKLSNSNRKNSKSSH